MSDKSIDVSSPGLDEPSEINAISLHFSFGRVVGTQTKVEYERHSLLGSKAEGAAGISHVIHKDGHTALQWTNAWLAVDSNMHETMCANSNKEHHAYAYAHMTKATDEQTDR
jgi:hypothetical protein